MYEETIARIAVTSAAVIRIARLLLIALLVCSIGRLTTTAPARSPTFGLHPVLAVGRELVMVVVDMVVPSFPWQSIRQLDLKKTAWMYWNSFLFGVSCSAHMGVPSAKRGASRANGLVLRRFLGTRGLDERSRAVARSNSSRGCFLRRLALSGSSTLGLVVGQIVERLQVVGQDLEDRARSSRCPATCSGWFMSAAATSIRAVWVVCLRHQALGLLAVPEEAGRDQDEDAQPEDEAALALQAGLAEQVLEAAIGHESRSSGLVFPLSQPSYGRSGELSRARDGSGHPCI